VSGWQLTWIVLGIMLLGIGVLIAALMTLPSRSRSLKRALRRLSWRAEEAQRLQVKALALQVKAADLQAKAADLQAHLAPLSADHVLPTMIAPKSPLSAHDHADHEPDDRRSGPTKAQ
jgi:hypothetical protein